MRYAGRGETLTSTLVSGRAPRGVRCPRRPRPAPGQSRTLHPRPSSRNPARPASRAAPTSRRPTPARNSTVRAASRSVVARVARAPGRELWCKSATGPNVSSLSDPADGSVEDASAPTPTPSATASTGVEASPPSSTATGATSPSPITNVDPPRPPTSPEKSGSCGACAVGRRTESTDPVAGPWLVLVAAAARRRRR